VAELRDGWLSWEMGGYVGRWVAKLGDGWLSCEMGGYVGRWAAKLVARLLATAALWFESRHLSRKENW
jgi:hypothetical protein